jgi:aspartate/methionine/tyrosine aminotransferase
MPSPVERVLTTPHSGIRRMIDIAVKAPSPIMLLGGDPNFTTPGHIIDGAARAARAGATGYAPGGGIPALREAIVEKVRDRNGAPCSVEQVVVTTGGCGGLFTSLLLLLEPGSELLIPDPGWSNYPAMAHVLNAVAVGYPLDRERNMRLDVEALERLVTDRTRAVIVNSPGNPTGAVESEQNLRAVLEVASRHDLWVISDECYDELIFDGRHTSMASLGDAERVVTVFTFSKSYAMTGWRVGYVVAPAELADLLSLHQEPVVSCASTISQHAALTALRGPQDCVQEMVAAYRDRRAIAAGELDRRGVPHVWPAGGFFLMVDISAAGMDSWAFCRRLLDETDVALVPGSAFGACGEGYARVSLAAAEETVAEGMRRLAAFVDRLRDAA